MSKTNNEIVAYFKGRKGVCESVYQYDYGRVLVLDDRDYTDPFDAYFEVSGADESIPVVGRENRIAIPNSCLANSGKVTLHIPIHEGENDSEVEDIITFRVIGRAKPMDDGTPAEQSALAQAIALLKRPITYIEQIVNEALAFTGTTFEQFREEINSFKSDVNEYKDEINSSVTNLVTNVKPDTVKTLWTGTLDNTHTSATLSETVANFDFIDFYYAGNPDSFARIPVSQGFAEFTATEFAETDDKSLTVYKLGVNFSGTTVTVTKSKYYDFTGGTAYQAPVVASGFAGIINRIDGVKIASLTPAELTDIRTGADGISYSSAGDAVRGQVSDLKSEINALENGSINYTEGYGITTNGTVVATEGVCLSDFIPVEGSTAYVTVSSALAPSHRSNLNIIEYSEDKSFVDYWGANPTKTFTTSGRTRYIRFSFDAGFEATATKYATSEIIYEATLTESLNERIDSRAETVVQATDWDNVIPSSRHDPNTNYIDPEKVTSGYINANGVYTPDETLQCTDYIPLEAGKTYYKGIGVYGGTYYGYYDEDYNVVASGSTLGELTSSFVVPNNAKYGRFTLGNGAAGDDIVWIFTQNGAPEHYKTEYYFGEKMSGAVRTAVEIETDPTEYKGMNIQAFDTCVCIGDSLTEGIFNYNNGGSTGYISIPDVSYPSALERITGVNVTNLGVSGYTSLEWYNANQDTDLRGHKFAIVQFGVNDVIEYGGWTQNSVDGYTGIINKLKADNANIKIFISTVMPAISYPASDYTAFNTALKAFVENLEDADVILLDMATYGNTAPAQYNAGHLSAYGYWRLAKDYANYISWYMHNNGMQFREIQFIGTDKHY